jgi:hypothetical protein
VTRFRLRHQGSDLELPATGPFVIGRSSTCNLALDDALVSRRHAVLEVRSGAVHVEDLGSRNGVLVNGARIEGTRKLSHLDRVTIGANDLVVVHVSDEVGVRCDACGAAGAQPGGRCVRCGAPVGRGLNATLAGGQAIDMSTLTDAKSDEEPTVVGSLLASIADKALALGRYDEAERVLSRVLVEVLARVQRGESISPGRLAEATTYALKLADGARKSAWIDWVFEVHGAAGTLISAPDIEKLHEIVRRLKYTNAGALRRYLERVAQRIPELSPAQRFQVQRLEGLLRVVSA